MDLRAPESTAELVLLNVSQRHRVPPGTAVLTSHLTEARRGETRNRYR